MEDESGVLVDDGKSWPPVPAQEQELGSPAKEPSRAELAGRKSLRCCHIATAFTVLYTLSIAIDIRFSSNVGSNVYLVVCFPMQVVSIGLFVVGLIYGLFGLRSWEGKVGLALALTSPVWIVIDIFTFIIFSSML